jgi:catechol 2,3-dioxygenase-like lactoylglutathione lyase family enzyme
MKVRLALSCIAFALLMLCTSIADATTLRIVRIVLTVSDLSRTEAFYRDGLGFERIGQGIIDDPAYQHLIGVEGAKIHWLRMRLGGDEVEFQQYDKAGKPYPADSRSPDLWFQHFAIIVADMPKAYEALRTHVALTPISDGGPQTLPPQNGFVQAYKFRDPDGHPLELLYFPKGQGRPVWHRLQETKLFLGIDHSAIGVSDTPRSTDFYARLLGLKQAYGIVNRGPTQEHLDGSFNAVVQITGFLPAGGDGPGVEFLDYRTPPTGRPAPVDTASNDIAHVHLQLAVDRLDDTAETLFAQRVPFVSPGVIAVDPRRYGFSKALMIRDPDGHAVMLAE